jgi:hypothetical protein
VPPKRHFKGGKLTCTVTSTSTRSSSTTCEASLTRLRNQDVLVLTRVSGSAVYQCQDNGGGIAPGQNKVLVAPTISSTSIPASQIKNGNLKFSTNPSVLTAPSTVSAQQAGCPDNNWTGVNPVLTTASIILTFQQPPGTTIFTCTTSDSNGLTERVALKDVQLWKLEKGVRSSPILARKPSMRPGR